MRKFISILLIITLLPLVSAIEVIEETTKTYSIPMVDGKDITIERSNYDPLPAEPGKYVDIWITVQNYGNSEIKNAAAPITGGVNCPFVDDATSIAPAFSDEKPVFFIKGIVKVPVVTTFAIDEPEYIPDKPDATTAALAGPPRK